jgi:hypothetical protein
MKNDHEKLITALVNDLKPVAKPAGFVMPFQLWLMMAVLFASGLAWLMGPYRPKALAQLAASLQFSVETVVGCIAITMIAFIAFRSAIPSGMTEFKQRVMPITWELVDYTVKELTETLYTETERNALGIKLAS